MLGVIRSRVPASRRMRSIHRRSRRASPTIGVKLRYPPPISQYCPMTASNNSDGMNPRGRVCAEYGQNTQSALQMLTVSQKSMMGRIRPVSPRILLHAPDSFKIRRVLDDIALDRAPLSASIVESRYWLLGSWLPASPSRVSSRQATAPAAKPVRYSTWPSVAGSTGPLQPRSEERRVGKE